MRDNDAGHIVKKIVVALDEDHIEDVTRRPREQRERFLAPSKATDREDAERLLRASATEPNGFPPDLLWRSCRRSFIRWCGSNAMIGAKYREGTAPVFPRPHLPPVGRTLLDDARASQQRIVPPANLGFSYPPVPERSWGVQAPPASVRTFASSPANPFPGSLGGVPRVPPVPAGMLAEFDRLQQAIDGPPISEDAERAYDELLTNAVDGTKGGMVTLADAYAAFAVETAVQSYHETVFSDYNLNAIGEQRRIAAALLEVYGHLLFPGQDVTADLIAHDVKAHLARLGAVLREMATALRNDTPGRA